MLYLLDLLPSKHLKVKTLFVSYEGSNSDHVSVVLGQLAAKKRLLEQQKNSEAQKKLHSKLQKALRTDFKDFINSHENSSEENKESRFGSNGISDQFGEGVKISNSLELIWKKIRSRVSYRSEHLLSRVSGKVTINIRIDKKGRLVKIFESEALGDQRLVGWVVLCLIEAFKDPIENLYLDGNMNLNLHFYFSLGEPVPEPQMGLKMVFPVIGDESGGAISHLASGNFERLAEDVSYREEDGVVYSNIVLFRVSTDRIKNLFKDKRLKNHNDWDFYSKLETYKRYCEESKNSQGCLLLAGLYRSIGNHHEAHMYEKLAREYEVEQNE